MPWLFSAACCVVWIASSRKEHDAAALSWIAAAIISTGVGLLQYIGTADALTPWVNTTRVGEAFGNLRQRNQFATLTTIGIASVLWFAGRHSHRWQVALIVHAAIAWLAMGTAISASRTGMVQLMLIVMLAVIWRDAHKLAIRALLGTALLVYGLTPFLLPWLTGLDTTMGPFARLRAGDAICSSRFTLWSNVLHLIAQKPWFGWGWGELDYAHFITRYPGPRFCDILDNAHNLPLHLSVEFGVPVAVAVCVVGLYLVWRLKPWRETRPERQLAWAVLALILLHSMLEYPLWYGPFQIAVVLCVWLLWSTRGAAPAQSTAYSGDVMVARWRPALLTGCALALSTTMYAAWDYQRISQLYVEPSRRAPAYRENTLEKAQQSRLFRNQVDFAELTTMTLTRESAPRVHAMAMRLLHFSPEPRVVQRLIESAVMLGRNDEALYYLERFKAAFPKDHAAWAQALKIPL